MTKNEIREIVSRMRKSLDAGWIAAASRTIQQRVLNLPEFEAARVVCGYVALPREVQTDLVFAAARKRGKRICVPSYRPEDGAYGLAEVAEETDWKPGHGGVREPAQPMWMEPGLVDFAMVPGVAFDLRGGRVGRGKGYYDRILGGLNRRAVRAVGLAFGFQVFEQVPMESHDVRVDTVITEDDAAAARAAAQDSNGGGKWE
jgi:5-formyltetrahydrofolate cyclo-ligase